MGRIPEHIVEQVLSGVDIVEIISGVIPLKKAGRNFKACCPFHQEKTPSFVVSADKQIYHCFGCGQSGNAIRFLMSYERMEFLEALKTLAGKAGVRLPESGADLSHKEHLATRLYQVNEMAAQFYAQSLLERSAQGARAYLKKRLIKEETVRAFRLGFAPDAWDSLILHARAQGVSLGLLEKAGLVLPKQGGGYYDRFRNRLIFPISDLRGRITGFGARVLDDSLPKYINSPESAVYTKGRHLYGFSSAKESIREADSAIVVEGYLDCIVPFQAGLTNVVASLGTALTTEQVRLLKRYTHNVAVIYDADAAGELAALRSLDIFADEEIDARIVSLPKGHDPDSFIRAEGADALRACVEKAESIFAYKLRLLSARYSVNESEGKARIASSMLETIGRIRNEVLKSEYVRRLASRLHVHEEALFAELKKPRRSAEARRPAHGQPVPAGQVVSPLERLLLKMMLEESDIIHWVREHLEPGDFTDSRISSIVGLMFELIAEGKKITAATIMSYLREDDVSRIICESAFMPDDLTGQQKERVVSDCVGRLKAQKMQRMRISLEQQILTAQNSGDDAAVDRLIEEFNCLLKEKV